MSTPDFLRSRLDAMIDMRYPLVGVVGRTSLGPDRSRVGDQVRAARLTVGAYIEQRHGRSHRSGPVRPWDGELAAAIRKGLTAEDLKTTMFAYPTTTSDIGYML